MLTIAVMMIALAIGASVPVLYIFFPNRSSGLIGGWIVYLVGLAVLGYLLGQQWVVEEKTALTPWRAS